MLTALTVVIVLVHRVRHQLARCRVEILRKSVDRSSADHILGSGVQSSRQGSQPIMGGGTVIIGKGYEFSFCLHRTPVACSSRTGVSLSDQCQIKFSAKPLHAIA